MAPELRRLLWEERLVGRAYTCRIGQRRGAEGSFWMAIVGGLAQAFLLYFGPRSMNGGGVPTAALLQVAVPIALASILAFFCDLADLQPRVLRLDPERLTFGGERGEPDKIVATADVHDLVHTTYLVSLVDREGKTLLQVGTCAPAYVVGKLRAALDAVREARTYRA